ncbi:MAG: hypothetical protein M0Q91_17600 [Methanoregula sp.]|nr:hypothetical protein [Methanoregula sp.]
MQEVPCVCGKVAVMGDHQWQHHCDCGRTVWTTNTYCFFCGKITTDLKGDCDNPECIEKYRKVKEEKKHPFFV